MVTTANQCTTDVVVIIGDHEVVIEMMAMIQNLVDIIGAVEHRIQDQEAGLRLILPRLILDKGTIRHMRAENILRPFHK